MSRQQNLRAQRKIPRSTSTQLRMRFCSRLFICSAKMEFSLSAALIGLGDNSEHSNRLLK